MSASSPALGIVVVDYHTQSELKEFCQALLAADPQIAYTLMISVVDSTVMEAINATEMADWFSSRALVSATYTYQSNVGFNVAVNDAAAWTLDLPLEKDNLTLAFFNSDTRIRPGVLESCVKLLWSKEDYGVVGPRQVSDENKFTAAGIFGTLRQPRHRGWQEWATKGRYEDVREDSINISGSAYFIKAPLWSEMANCPAYRVVDPSSTGAFLTCRHYYGETFCSYHLQAHGYKLVYNGEATMIHKWHKASPVGKDSFAERNLWADREFFRRACDAHANDLYPEGIPHD